jgi:hypothetical protein
MCVWPGGDDSVMMPRMLARVDARRPGSWGGREGGREGGRTRVLVAGCCRDA